MFTMRNGNAAIFILNRLMLIVGVAIFLSAACGSLPTAQNKNESTLSPSDRFDSFVDQKGSTPRCRNVDGGGCGEVYSSGTAVGGQFNFRELYSTCDSDNDGWTLSLRNSVDKNLSTFNLRVFIYGQSSPGKQHVCKGPEYFKDPDTGAQTLKTGFCEVNVVNNDFSIGATSRTPCLLVLSNSDQIAGSISCPMLDRNSSFMMIQGNSHFDCKRKE